MEQVPPLNHTNVNITIWGRLILHRGHMLRTTAEYQVPEGKVYGTLHVLVRCCQCNEQIWDEEI